MTTIVINKKSETLKYTREQGLDKFYTIPEIAIKCIDIVNEYSKIDTYDLVVEPSAGSGNFLLYIPTKNKIGIDIHPEHESIIKMDFFDYTPSLDIKHVLTIGNPPFGKISSLAIKFFNHSANFSSTVAFIIPRTFRKNSVQNKLDLNFHLIHDSDIPSSPCSFIPKMSVKCCFQIWIKKNVLRNIVKLSTTHKDWSWIPFGKKDDLGQPTV